MRKVILVSVIVILSVWPQQAKAQVEYYVFFPIIMKGAENVSYLNSTCSSQDLGPVYRGLVANSAAILDQAYWWSAELAEDFSPTDAQDKGETAGENMGTLWSIMSELYSKLNEIIPQDVIIVITLRMAVMFIMALLGVVGRAKLIKWW